MNVKHPLAIVAALAFVGGAGLGNASASSTEAPSPAPVVQPTPQVIRPTPEIITQSVSSEIEVTPQACLDAIEYAREFADYSSATMDAITPVIKAMGGTEYEQIVAMQTAGDTINGLNDKYAGLADSFNAAAAECQSH